MVSLEEHPREISESDPVGDVMQWPATRGPSLEDEEEAAKFASEVTAAIQSKFSQLPTSEASIVLQAPAPRWSSIEDEEEFPDLMKNLTQLEGNEANEASSIQWPANRVPPLNEWPATRGPSLDEFTQAPQLSILDLLVKPTVASAEGPFQDSAILNPPGFSKICWNAFMGPPGFYNLEPLLAAPVVPEEGNTSSELSPPWTAMEDETINKVTAFQESETLSEEQRWLRGLARKHGIPVPQVEEMYGTFSQHDANNLMKAKSSLMHMEFFQKSESFASDASTAVSADEDQSLTTPQSGLSDDEADTRKDTSATLKISLTDTLGLWSVGSAAHETGTCKPCAFLWKDLKQPGCQNGRDCIFCHLCPPGEVKRRKKEKMLMRKASKNLNRCNGLFAMGCHASFEAQYQDSSFEPQYQQSQLAAGHVIW